MCKRKQIAEYTQTFNTKLYKIKQNSILFTNTYMNLSYFKRLGNYKNDSDDLWGEAERNAEDCVIKILANFSS